LPGILKREHYDPVPLWPGRLCGHRTRRPLLHRPHRPHSHRRGDGRQLLLLRPRRFGKSLWLSTLANYYDIARAEQFEAQFGQLKIGQDPTPLNNQFFVMKWNFSTVEALRGADAIRRSLHNHLNVQILATARKYRPPDLSPTAFPPSPQKNLVQSCTYAPIAGGAHLSLESEFGF
jgi:hypothetical protein